MFYINFEDAISTIRERPVIQKKSSHRNSKITPVSARAEVLQNIIVPLDGTMSAEHAIPHAIFLARRTGANLKLVRVFLPTPSPLRHRHWDAFDHVEDQLRAEAHRYLDDLKKRIVEQVPDVNVVTHLLNANNVVDGLAEVTNKSDLTVISSRRRGWLSRFIVGSVEDEILHRYNRPTFFVPGDHSPVEHWGDPLHRRSGMPDGS